MVNLHFEYSAPLRPNQMLTLQLFDLIKPPQESKVVSYSITSFGSKLIPVWQSARR